MVFRGSPALSGFRTHKLLAGLRLPVVIGVETSKGEIYADKIGLAVAGHTSVLAHKAGLGKLPIIPTYVREEALPDGSGTTVKCRNYAGKTVEMPGLGQEFRVPSRTN